MVQILPRAPSFLEQLTPHLSSIAGSIGEGIGKRAQNQQEEAVIAKLNDPNTNPIDYPMLVGKLSKDKQPLYRDRIKEGEKKITAKADQKTQTADAQGIFNDMAGYLKTGTLGSSYDPSSPAMGFLGPLGGFLSKSNPILNRESATYRAAFDNANQKFLEIAREQVSKGTLSDKDFAYIVAHTASADKSDRTNLGFLYENAKKLKLDDSALEGIPGYKELKDLHEKANPKSASNGLQKAKKGEKLSDEMAAKIFAQAGDDKKKAREIAEGLGYEF